MQTAIAPRYRRRLTCGLRFGSERKPAVVLNLSTSGVFVQTSLRPPRGDRVVLDLSLPGGGPQSEQRIELGGDVVWRSEVAARFSSVSAGGVGIHLRQPPSAYLDFVRTLAPGAAAVPEDAPGRRYRVRLVQRGTTRSRWVAVAGDDDAAARGAAVDQLGEGWDVLELRCDD